MLFVVCCLSVSEWKWTAHPVESPDFAGSHKSLTMPNYIYKQPYGVQKPGPQYSPAIYTMDIAYKIDIPLYIFDWYITGI